MHWKTQDHRLSPHLFLGLMSASTLLEVRHFWKVVVHSLVLPQHGHWMHVAGIVQLADLRESEGGATQGAADLAKASMS